MNSMNSSNVVLSTKQFINSFTLFGQIKKTSRVVFINPQVKDYQQLVSGAIPGAIVVLLDATQDGIQQITQCIGCHHLSEVHIISHSAPGCLHLGSSQLNFNRLDQYTLALISWSVDTIFLYGCNLASGDAGSEFIQKLHQMTGSGIVASTTKIL